MTSPLPPAQELSIVPRTNGISIAIPSVPSSQEIEALSAMSKIAAYSGFLTSTAQDATRRAADAFFVMMYGRELGIPAMTALKTIYVIDGKPSCSGQALLALMRKGGVDVEMPDPGTVTDKAAVKVKRPGSSTWKTYTYTLKMAEKAGLLGKGNWKKSPAEMLIWRAVSTACRFEAPDIVGGLYTIEELNPDQPVNEQGDPLNMPIVTTITPPVEPEPEPDPAPQVAADESPKSDAVQDSLSGTDVPQSEPGPATVEDDDGMPDELFQRFMNDASIKDTGASGPERANTVRKMWAENLLMGEYKDSAKLVIERLNSHKTEGAK